MRKAFDQAAQNPKFVADFKAKCGSALVWVDGTHTTRNVLDALKTIVKDKAGMKTYMKK